MAQCILISLHAEIPEKLGAIEMHEITERCEHKLRTTFGGEAVLPYGSNDGDDSGNRGHRRRV